MKICKGSIKLGTACGKCSHCAKERANMADGYYWVLPHGSNEHYGGWTVCELADGVFWQPASDVGVAPWVIDRVMGPISEPVGDVDTSDSLHFHARSLLAAYKGNLRDMGNATARYDFHLASLDIGKAIETYEKGIPK